MNIVFPLPLLLLALTATPGAQQQQRSNGGPACSVPQDIRESLTRIEEDIDREGSRILTGEEWGYLKYSCGADSEAEEELRASIETLKNATAQLLEELSVVRGRQAASSAVQASQVILLLGYFITILVIFCIKRCKKHQEEVAKAEFELLEANLRSSKARRRAAAAQEKSAQAHSLE